MIPNAGVLHVTEKKMVTTATGTFSYGHEGFIVRLLWGL